MSKTETAGEVRKVLEGVKDLLADPALGKINEATTRTHIITPLLSALGYKAIGDLELEIYLADSKTFLDYRLVVDGQAVASVEAKALGVSLADKDGAQVVQYANLLADRWAVVTNGQRWRLYETFAQVPLQEKLIFDLNLVTWTTDSEYEHLFDRLWLLSKESFQMSGGPKSWVAERNMASLLRATLSDPSSPEIKHIRKRLADQGLPVSAEAIAGWLKPRVDRETSAPPPSASPGSQKVPHTATHNQTGSTIPALIEPPRAGRPPTDSPFWLIPAGQRQGAKSSEHLKTWLNRGYWGFWENTPGRLRIHSGHRICFYAAGENMILATATATGDIDRLVTESEWPENYPPLKPTYKVPLTEIEWLTPPIKLDIELRRSLDWFAVHSPEVGWSWFVQTTRRLSAADFHRLTTN